MSSKIETYRRADGILMYRARPWDAVNRKRLPSRSFASESDAVVYLRQCEGRTDRTYTDGGITPTRRQHRALFAAYCDHWAATYNVGEVNTRSAAASHARQLAAVWPSSTVDEVTEPMIAAYMGRLEVEGKSPSTRASRLSVLRLIMNRAIDEGHRDDHPCRNLKAPKQSRAYKGRVMTTDEIDRILLVLPDWLRPAALLSLDCGLRVGEVCGLRWDSVSLDMRMVRVGDVILANGSERDYPKGKETATLIMTPRVVEALREHADRYPGKGQDRVFREPGRNLPFTNPHRIKVLWAAARRKAWLTAPLPRWHDLRHWCANDMLAAGTPPVIVQGIMRHADLSTTQNYIAKVSLSDQRKWQDRRNAG